MFEVTIFGRSADPVWFEMTEYIAPMFGLLGVVLGSVISWLAARWRYNRERDNIRIRSASILIASLQNYSARCSIYLANTQMDAQDQDQVTANAFDVPDFPTLPPEIDFSSIEVTSASKALLLSGETELERFAIAAIENRRNNDWKRDIYRRIATHGLKFHKLSEEIRTHNKLADPNPDRLGWDYLSALKRAAERKG